MATTIFKDSDNRQIYGRGYARGLKTFELGEGVVSGVDVDFAIQGDKLVAVKSEDASNVGPIAFIGKQFGLVGRDVGLVSKVDVLLLGDGLMLVTLVSGALVLELDGAISPVAVGSIPQNMMFSEKAIDWVTRGDIMQYIGHFDNQREYPFEYEFVFEFGIQSTWGRSVKHVPDEDADISMGYIAERQAEIAARHRSRELSTSFSRMLESIRTDFDHDEEDDDDAAFYALEAEGDEEEYLGAPLKKTTRKSKKSKAADDEDFDDYYL